ncbi:D-Ala-D-Ala carboxypeptidase family metallohydrolase [Maricaulis sp.]|uniref:D-Ala-D-Ala carboxypeptidase family metallohydrolase n=1 Tax=Maricaulis sp. TaxID=1486257 RepID=UPI003A90B1E4
MKKLLGKAVLSAVLVSALPQVAQARVLNPSPAQTQPPASTFEAGHLPFSITLRDELEVNLDTFAVFAHPGETIRIRSDKALSWVEGDTSRPAATELDWTAPATPGLTQVRLEDENGHAMQLNLLVMHAHTPEDGEAINGYRLGNYPAEPYLGHANYRAPENFLEVSDGMADLAVSPHFRLGQFLCKQPTDGAPYLVLSERLLVKLEGILEAANERGWRADTFTVMSGYRTPAYNAGLGNGRHSRHIYGGAADIFIDSDGDGVMDDLNGDGVHDRQDAAALFDLVDSLSHNSPAFTPLIGGLGEYAPTSNHGPFVHVDERGWRARWGRS